MRRKIYQAVTFQMFALLFFGMISCGNEKRAEEGSSEASLEAVSEIRVGYISKNTTHPFHQEINQYAEEIFDGLAEEGIIGSWTGVLDGKNFPDVQNNLAKQCIDEKCDYVFIVPCEAEAVDPAVTLMAEAGIKVIVFNSKTASTDEAAWVYVGSEEEEAGKQVGQYVSDNCQESGKYVHINYIQGSIAHIGFSQGFHEILDARTDLEQVSDDYLGMWELMEEGQLEAETADIVLKAINEYGGALQAVICDTDEISAAAQKACNEAGYPEILCVGIGDGRMTVDMVKRGEMKAAFVEDGVGQLQKGIDCMLEDIDGKNSLAESTACRGIQVEYLLVTGQ